MKRASSVGHANDIFFYREEIIRYSMLKLNLTNLSGNYLEFREVSYYLWLEVRDKMFFVLK